MKKVFFSVLFFLLTIGAFAQTADEIVSKHLAAIGGDALNNLKTMQMELKMTSQATPGIEIAMTMTVVNRKAALVKVSVMGMTQVICINGENGWATNPFVGKPDPEPITADQMAFMKGVSDINGPLHNYKEKGYAVEYMGKETFDGAEVHKLKIVENATQTQYILIDPETWYNVKITTVETIDGTEVTSESIYSNFKSESGIVMPFTVEQPDMMGGASIMTVTTLRINEPVDEKVFEMPTKE